MGILNLKKWSEICTTGTVVTQNLFTWCRQNTDFGDYQDVLEYIGYDIYTALNTRRTYFDNLTDYENCFKAFTLANKLKIRYYLVTNFSPDDPIMGRWKRYRESTEMDPLQNKETLTKTGTVTLGKSGSDTERTIADKNDNYDENTRTGSVSNSADTTNKHYFEESSSLNISDTPTSNGVSNGTTTYNSLKDKDAHNKDETKTLTKNTTDTTTNNTTDIKSFQKNETKNIEEEDNDPYSLVHLNNFVTAYLNITSLYIDFFKKWTSPVVR